MNPLWVGPQELYLQRTPARHERKNNLFVSGFMKLNVDPCGPSLDLEVPLEIIIGTIPLRQAVELCPPCAPQPFQPPVGFPVTVGGIGGVGATPSVPLQPEMPYLPPSNIPNLRMYSLEPNVCTVLSRE